MAVLNDYLNVLILCKLLLCTFRCSEHYLKMRTFFYYSLVSVFSLSQIFDRKNSLRLAYSSQFKNVPVTFQANFIFSSQKLSFALNKFYCHRRLTWGVKNKKTCQTFCTFSVNGSFIYSVIHKVSSFFKRQYELITERTARESKTQPDVMANVEAEHDSSFFKTFQGS